MGGTGDLSRTSGPGTLRSPSAGARHPTETPHVTSLHAWPHRSRSLGCSPRLGTWHNAQHLAAGCSAAAFDERKQAWNSLGKATAADIALSLKYNDLKHEEIQTSQSKQNSTGHNSSSICSIKPRDLTGLPACPSSVLLGL